MSGSSPIPGLTPAVAAFLTSRRVGRMATVTPDSQPHVVPICYVFDGAAISLVLDQKPKRVPITSLKRVRNILANPRVAVVVDDYSEDWSHLAYVLAHGEAEILEPSHPLHARTLSQLRDKYPHYRQMALADRPIIRITLYSVTAWGAIDQTA